MRVVGSMSAEDRPIELDEKWNLVSYLPRQTLGITEALASIEGQYTAVLGFEQGALSYYPHLDPSINTLHTLKPLHGYWIKTTQADTLQYPVTGGGFATADRRPPTPEETALAERVAGIRQAERGAGVRPTYTWVNFYGTVHTPTGLSTGLVDGAPSTAEATVQALDPDGVVCGAAPIIDASRYGLLACYGDDPDTPEDEGARQGDIIQLVVDGQVLGTAVWTAHGDLTEVNLGAETIDRPWQVWLPVIRK